MAGHSSIGTWSESRLMNNRDEFTDIGDASERAKKTDEAMIKEDIYPRQALQKSCKGNGN